MRRFYVAVAASLFAMSSGSFAAQTSGAIRNKEVLVQTAATGVSVVQADRATVTLNLHKTGATNQEARANVRSFANQLPRYSEAEH